MRRSGNLLVIAAAGGLLASGCDYWRNLVEDKNADKARLVVVVTDALTGEPLQEAFCGKQGQGMVGADGEGTIARDDMPTGKYNLVCRAQYYHERSIPIEVPLGETRKEVRLARLGGDWYPGRKELEPGIVLAQGNHRYPGSLKLKAVPSDDSGRFLYEWTSNLHAYPLDPGKPVCRLAECVFYTPKSVAATQALEVSLRIRFKGKGDSAIHDVGTVTYARDMVRNLPPEIRIDTNANRIQSFKLGCGNAEQVAIFAFMSTDPDHGCKHVVIENTDASSSLGIIREEVPCGLQQKYYPVKVRLGPPESSIYDTSIIRFQVVDSNGETAETVAKVEGYTNLAPIVKLNLLTRKDRYFTVDGLDFELESFDRDSKRLKVIKLDYGDGEIDSGSLDGQEEPFHRIYHKEFKKPGLYNVMASVLDNCQGGHKDSLQIQVFENKPPIIEFMRVEGYGPNTGDFQLRLKIMDADLSDGVDTLRGVIYWDDVDDTPIVGFPSQPLDGIFRHTYVKDPNEMAADSLFHVHVSVTDKNGGFDSSSVFIRKADVFRP